MTCMAVTTADMHSHNDKFFPAADRFTGWTRKQHCLDDFSSDEEQHNPSALVLEKQSLDRLKEIHDLSMRATLLNAEAYRYADESMTQNNRKRLFSEYNTSPVDHRPTEHQQQHDDGRYRLTLSQFATSASEQEPLYPKDDEDVEEILMRLRHGHDYYRPKATPPPTLPSILFAAPPTHVNHNYYHIENHLNYAPPPHNKASLFHILSQESENVDNLNHMSVHNHHARRMFFEDEEFLEHPKKKVRRDNKNKSPNMKLMLESGEVQERENVAAGLCFKTHKPKVQREYYYAKLSKTIFRWTCCGSQAKTHPDA